MSSLSSHKITTWRKYMLWRPRGINSLLWHSSTFLLWSQYLQNLFESSVLIQNAECFLEDVYFSLVPSLPHWMWIAIGGRIPNSSEIKRQVRNNFHTSCGLKLVGISTMQNCMGGKHGKAVLTLWKYWDFENDMAWTDRMGPSDVSSLGYTFTLLHQRTGETGKVTTGRNGVCPKQHKIYSHHKMLYKMTHRWWDKRIARQKSNVMFHKVIVALHCLI